jgi:hypothetical protein
VQPSNGFQVWTVGVAIEHFFLSRVLGDSFIFQLRAQPLVDDLDGCAASAALMELFLIELYAGVAQQF